MKPSITVAIVTRNRAKDLQECLVSLTRQSIRPDKIFIVDNASSDNTREIIAEFSKKIAIRSVCEKTTGYPAVYNRAIREVKTRWVAFIDDDCAVDTQWFSEIVKATKQYVSYAAIIGASKNYSPKNVYACAFQFWYDYWRRRSTSGTRILDYRALDSRNVVFNKELLIKHNIVFDPAFVGGAEDSDFGLQINYQGQSAVYISRMVVYHKEPTSLRSFLYKKRAYAVASLKLNGKWHSLHAAPLFFIGRLVLLREVFRRTTSNLPIVRKAQALFIITMDFCCSRFHVYEFFTRNLTPSHRA